MGRGFDFEVAVIGGGPGGSAAAARLARHGRRVLLLERETFPRYHVGESHLPWSDEVFRALGCDDLIAKAGFAQAGGVSFASHDGRARQRADFALAVETPRPRAYQAPRERFDQILLRHAEKSGAAVLQGARAVDAIFDGRGATLNYIDARGLAHTVKAAAVVDASGRAGFLAKRFGRRVADPALRTVALHARFEGVARTEKGRADTRVVTRPDGAWMWLTPVTSTITSVGAVVPRAVHGGAGGDSIEGRLQWYLEETPAAAELMPGARRVSPARFEADYSYLHTQHAGDRWLMVGDAGGFLDPIFSTGVLLAMQSGLEAADAVHAGLAARDLSRRRFAPYESVVRRRHRHFRRFAVRFYDPAFRDVLFAPSRRFRTFEALLSVLAGNWRPSLHTRVRLALFLGMSTLQRVVPVAARSHTRRPAATRAAR